MIKKYALGVLVVIFVLAGAFLVWGLTPSRPMPEASAASQSSSVVTVTFDEYLVFQPAGDQPETGLILYPGGRIDYRAYAPLAMSIAEQGYLVVIPPMPLSLAVFSPEKAAQVVAAYPEIQNWVIGGHSLGGAMAARYARQHLDQIDGLVLLASYPAESDSLAQSDLPVVSISGELDGLSTTEKINASRALLPGDAQFVVIQGGNHSQFGWYGSQNGDGEAKISRREQQAQTVAAITEFLALLQNE